MTPIQHYPIIVWCVCVFQRLKEEVLNAHNLQEMYREQVISLEDDLARLREQDDLKNDDFNVDEQHSSLTPIACLLVDIVRMCLRFF